MLRKKAEVPLFFFFPFIEYKEGLRRHSRALVAWFWAKGFRLPSLRRGTGPDDLQSSNLNHSVIVWKGYTQGEVAFWRSLAQLGLEIMAFLPWTGIFTPNFQMRTPNSVVRESVRLCPQLCVLAVSFWQVSTYFSTVWPNFAFSSFRGMILDFIGSLWVNFMFWDRKNWWGVERRGVYSSSYTSRFFVGLLICLFV